ncbi:hypothetical protein B379_08025 [Anoxybacillus ayderensis G10]|uniref:hypothetical protein n=1 Tax=Anoxybacillus gonensis TaxID=198467 RepID=UPI0002D4AE45|nr:hypothetical protein B379_08025 [Anoxybacillus ayderensis G10]
MQVIYSKYNRERLPNYQIETSIYVLNEKRYVRKRALNTEARIHINRIYSNLVLLGNRYKHVIVPCAELKEDSVVMEYREERTFESYLLEAVLNNNKNLFLKRLSEFYQFLESLQPNLQEEFMPCKEFINVFGDIGLIKNVKCLEVSNIDLIFENALITENGTFVIIDSEWVFPFNIPVLYILWRALYIFFHKYPQYLRNFTEYEEILNYVGIYKDLEKKFIVMEDNFLRTVYGEDKKRIISKNYLKPINTIDNLINYAEDKQRELSALDREYSEYKLSREKEFKQVLESLQKEYELKIKELENYIEQKENIITTLSRLNDEMKFSTSWRITKPLRKAGEISRKILVKTKKLIRTGWEDKNSSHIRQLYREIEKVKQMCVVLSHTNYLISLGGTEKYIYEQYEYLQQKSIDLLQIFPDDKYSFLGEEKSLLYGVNLNKEFVGYFTSDQIVNVLKSFFSRILNVYIHHLLNWQYRDVKVLTNFFKLNNIKQIYFLHDFYFSCSSVHMNFSSVENEITYPCVKHILDGDNIICTKCNFGSNLEPWRKIFNELIKQMYKVISPSLFVKEIFVKIYPDHVNKIEVREHLILEQRFKKKLSLNKGKIRIAYLGYKSLNKGWKTWEKIFKNDYFIEMYEFYHIGSSENYDPNVIAYDYSFIRNGRMAAVHLLEAHKIDLVLLWSTVPESYSYTLHESIAAGVPILTFEQSGNIARKIQEDSSLLGKVFKSEEELLSFLSNKEEVLKFLERTEGLWTYELKFNAMDIL